MEPTAFISIGNSYLPNYILGIILYMYILIYMTCLRAVSRFNIARSDTLKIFLTPPPDLVVSNVDIPQLLCQRKYRNQI